MSDQKQNFQQQIDQYNFPSDLDVKIVDKKIEFKLPVNITRDVKAELFNQPFYKKDNNIVINQKKNFNKYFIISGGKFETKIQSLLFILKNVIYNDKPIFEAEYIQPSRFPLPANRFHFLQQEIPYTLSDDDIDKVKDKLAIDISQKAPPQTLNKQLFTKNSTFLTTEEVYLLLTIFNPAQVQLILGLKQDENHDPQIFQLNIPIPINVKIQYKETDKYEISFADINQIKAEKIHKQIVDSLSIIKSTECILATFSKTDPIEHEDLMNELKLDDAIVAIIPDEKTLDDEFPTTYVEILLSNLNDNSNTIDENLKAYLKKVELAVCKKCKLFFCPSATDEKCYEYFHKGQQIPFESGQMEEIEFDEEEEIPIVYVNYSCCGECPKDEIPMNCGSKENGNHEKDEKEKVISSLTIEKTHPGNINRKQ